MTHITEPSASVVPAQFQAPSVTSTEGIKGKDKHDQDNLDKSEIKVEKNASTCAADASEETKAYVDVEAVSDSAPKNVDDEETITVKGKGKARVGAKAKTTADRESKAHGYPTRLAEKLRAAAKNGASSSDNETAAAIGSAGSSKTVRRVFLRLPDGPSTTSTSESPITQSSATARQSEHAMEERPVALSPRTPLRLAQGNVVPASPKTPKTPTIATSPVKENEDTSQPYERKPWKREGAFYEHYSGSRGQKRRWEEVETDVETEVETDKEQTPCRAAKRCRAVKILDNE